MGDFKLSASLAGHDDDVRAVSFPSASAVISASRDATVRLWKITSAPPPKFDDTISSHGASFINTVAYIPPSQDFPEGLIISGGKDTIIEVRQPGRSPEASAEALLLGHTSNVCALDVDPAGKFIVSGGWDGKARTWLVGKWECESVLEGHEGSVWAVLVYDSETIITGCADKHIRIYNPHGKLLRTIRGSQDVVRALCRVPKGHPSGADFASASNDGVIRLWTINGVQVGELHGHDSFIYSLAYLPSGEIVSSGEDRTVRVWKGDQCIQTITHPAISVWAVAACAENGDIVTGASDRIVRVFSRSTERLADKETILQFEESVRTSAIPQQQVGGSINKEKLPGPEFLQQKSGTKEGQVQMINEPNGSITAHQWSMSQQEWTNIGTVVDAAGSSGRKVGGDCSSSFPPLTVRQAEYQGKEFDYVFDVDIEEGKPPLRLPYNLSDNPYNAATKFLENNKLPISYLDQVANFITTNTQGASLGVPQDQGPAPAGSDPWGTESRYRPGGNTGPPAASTPVAPKVLPQKSYVSILTAAVDKMQKKIEEINLRMIQDGQKDLSLNPTELSVLQKLCRNLAPGATKFSQDVPGGLDLAIKLTTLWPYSDRLPGLDLLRLLAVAPATATYQHLRGDNLIDILEASISETSPPAPNHLMMAIRAFANLFESNEGRALALRSFDQIQSLSAASVAAHTGNRNLLVAATTLYINYAVLLSEQQPSSPHTFEHATAALEVLAGILRTARDSEVVYRAMVATGTLLGLGDEVSIAAQEVYEIHKCVDVAVRNAADPRIKNVGAEIKALLK
ncbi:MAG: hypothetical protein M1818_007724 [Claussenomyces sp. TS43310]|nr:MAG: hypothetical protein M1818_007724 [Claussenomyces sp. TS43310]